MDVLPTVLDLLDRPPLEVSRGGPCCRSSRVARGLLRRPYFEALSSSLNQGWAPLQGVLRDGFKYIDLPVPELYDLRADPAEKKNLLASQPEEAAALRAVLGRFRSEDRGSTRRQEDAATLDQLRALGYVSGGSPGPKEMYTEDDDPKNLIDVDARNREVLRLFRSGDIEGALEQCRQNLHRRPNMPLAWIHLGFLERARGNLDGAVKALRRAFELRPLDGEAATSTRCT